MDDFDPSRAFGRRVAADDATFERGDEAAAVDFLLRLADVGPALEFAIGTGRIGRRLVQAGVDVDGIEISPAMVEQLRAADGGDQLRVEIGDMSTVKMDRQYSLVFLVFNTIFNLLTADDQIRCFENAADHLLPGGAFVVEAAVPHAWVTPGTDGYTRPDSVGLQAVGLDVAKYDAQTQLLSENHVLITAEGVEFRPIVCRLITPGEMDLMARMAGLTLVDRVASWHGEPFDTTSLAHVSTYGRC